MSEIHEFKCDNCKTKAKANYNGEHYLPPRNWVSLEDVNLANSTGEHLCPKCLPKTPRNRGKNE